MCRTGGDGTARRPPRPELGRRQAAELELAMVRVAGARIGGESDTGAGVAGGRQHAPLDARAGARVGRLQEEAPTAADLVQRERDAQVAPAVHPRDAPHERRGAEVVRRAGDEALLGTGDDEPGVARWALVGEPRGQRGDDADARGVVVGPGQAGPRVGVGHDDRQAARGSVDDADQVARSSAAGHREALPADPQAGRPERRGGVALGPQLAGARRRARADRARYVQGGCVRRRALARGALSPHGGHRSPRAASRAVARRRLAPVRAGRGGCVARRCVARHCVARRGPGGGTGGGSEGGGDGRQSSHGGRPR